MKFQIQNHFLKITEKIKRNELMSDTKQLEKAKEELKTAETHLHRDISTAEQKFNRLKHEQVILQQNVEAAEVRYSQLNELTNSLCDDCWITKLLNVNKV